MNYQGLLEHAVSRSFPSELAGVSFAQLMFAASQPGTVLGAHRRQRQELLLVLWTQVEEISRAGEGDPIAEFGARHGNTCHHSFSPLMPSLYGWETQFRGNEFCVLTKFN